MREPDPKLTVHRAEAAEVAEAYSRVYLGGARGKWRGVAQQSSQLIKAKERLKDTPALIKTQQHAF